MTVSDVGVAEVELRRGPHNRLDAGLLEDLAAACADASRRSGAIVLCSEGRHFSVGVVHATTPVTPKSSRRFDDACRAIFGVDVPIVAAVQGRAIGGGLGLACAADFRVAGPSTSFEAPFATLGIHPVFGLTTTLPTLLGEQRARRLLLTGGALTGAAAVDAGLADELAPADDDIRAAAHRLATTLAEADRAAVRSIRSTLRASLLDRLDDAIAHERTELDRLRADGPLADTVNPIPPTITDGGSTGATDS